MLKWFIDFRCSTASGTTFESEQCRAKDSRSLISHIRTELSCATMCCQSLAAEKSSVKSMATTLARSHCHCSFAAPRTLCMAKHRADDNPTNKSTDFEPTTNQSSQGCMDEKACNYNPNATIHDIVACTFELVGQLI